MAEKPKANVERAKVTYDYNAKNEDEMSIKTGDLVDIVLKDTGQDGWWKVKLGEKIGLVPDNSVTVEVLLATTHPPPPTTSKPKPSPLPSEDYQQLPPKETPAPPTKALPPRNNSVSHPPPPNLAHSISVSRSTHLDRPLSPTEPKNTTPVKEEDASGIAVNPIDSFGSIYEALHRASDQWYNIAIKLNADYRELNKIRKSCGTDSDKCLQDILHHLFDTNPPTMKDVIEALESKLVDKNCLARDLRQKFIT